MHHCLPILNTYWRYLNHDKTGIQRIFIKTNSFIWTVQPDRTCRRRVCLPASARNSGSWNIRMQFLELQRAFVEAGTNILYAPTFTANRIKLAEYGLAEHLIDMNTELVGLAKQAAGGKALVAGDITMTGRQLTPMGDMDFEQLIDVYKEQIRVLDQAGVDLLVVETMMSLQETRAALIAAKKYLPFR